MRSLSLLTLCAITALIGCKEPGPKVAPEQLPKSLSLLESQTEEILAAFDEEDLEAADHVMHNLGKVYGTVNRLADQLLEQPQAVALKKAVKDHLNAMGELHEPLHGSELPEGFDLEPIREKLLASADAIRAALPEDIAAKLTEAAESRATAKATHGDDHDEDGEDHNDEHEGHDEDADHDHDEEGEEAEEAETE
ncbi:hypothetical protein MalM25_27700 [Planctomycetes bacterium MalM25]|nr:hypothetical protein MalM25_27700 [Planctomycetes bacterium MalM25]